jgi:hypothetical protein
MNILVRFFFVIVLGLSSTICFAGGKEEYTWLSNDLMVPFVVNFNDSSALTRLMSIKLIKYQKENLKRQLNRAEALSIMETTLLNREKPFDDDKRNSLMKDIRKCGKQAGGASGLATVVHMSWQNKASNCNEYAKSVMIALEFAQMNSIASGNGPIFKTAVVVGTYEEIYSYTSGLEIALNDHTFVLVEGLSGAMFAIDPWIWQVVKLDNFAKLSSIDPQITDLEKASSKSINLNLELNQIFSRQNGGYYDVIYVNSDTKWQLERKFSQNILNNVHTRNEDMRNLYDNVLMPKFHWAKTYDQLFPAKTTPSQ